MLVHFFKLLVASRMGRVLLRQGEVLQPRMIAKLADWGITEVAVEDDGSFSVEVQRARRTMRIIIHATVDLDAQARSALGQAAFAPVRAEVPVGAVDSIDVSFADE